MPPSIHSRSVPAIALSKKKGRSPGPPPVLASERSGLPLRELEALARAGLPVLLSLLHPRVAREHPRPLQLGPELRVELEQGPRDTVTPRARLTRQSAASDVHLHVELGRRARELEWLCHDEPEGLPGKVVLERPSVDRDPTLAGPEEHARHGRLPAS